MAPKKAAKPSLKQKTRAVQKEINALGKAITKNDKVGDRLAAKLEKANVKLAKLEARAAPVTA
jgi:peptidoglycan hydrolase CwlO-like protein